MVPTVQGQRYTANSHLQFSVVFIRNCLCLSMWGKGGTTIPPMLRSLKVFIQSCLDVEEVKAREFSVG